MSGHTAKISRDLWRVIYDIQGEAQQAAEGDRPCRSIENTWERLEKVLPTPYTAAPDLLEACRSVRTWIMEPFTAEDADSESLNPAFRKALRAVNEAIAKAEGK